VKLIFIYGPPAVGKLTVAKQLAKLTGFRLYHNHVSVDFVKSVFDFGTPAFWRMVDRVRRDVIEEAAKEGVDIIFTFVYAKGSDDEFVRDVAARVESNGGTFCPVRLYCNHEELLRRVPAASRKKIGKLVTKAGLIRMFQKFDMDSNVTVGNSLVLDTGRMPPKQAAKAVVRHYGLERTRTYVEMKK
jgi:tRNA uridine 5-carbamoylmethylation protein Kti12